MSRSSNGSLDRRRWRTSKSESQPLLEANAGVDMLDQERAAALAAMADHAIADLDDRRQLAASIDQPNITKGSR